MTTNSLAIYTPEKQREAIELLGYGKHSDAHLQLLFQLAEHYRLDVLSKEIALIPGRGPFIGVWGRLNIAHRSGQLDGLEMDDEWDTESGLYCVRCIVWRKDMSHPAAKVIGRVGKAEKKDWPFEIARARAVRAGTGYAFSIHDAYDTDETDTFTPPPDERLSAEATVVPADQTREEVSQPAKSAAKAPRRRRVNQETGEVSPEPAEGGHASGAVEDPATAPDSDPPTLQVGGHTLAQKIAIAARKAGIDDDDTRHDVIWAATNHQYRRGSDIPDNDPIIPRIFDAFTGLTDGTVELRYEPDGTPTLWKVNR